MQDPNTKLTRLLQSQTDNELAIWDAIESVEEGIAQKQEKGDKGDKGDVGEKGDKGDAGEKGEKGDKGDKGDSGKNGLDGKDGRDGLDGVGVDGIDGRDGLDGKDGSPDTGEQIIDKVNSVSKDGPKIDASHIKNLPNSVQTIIENRGYAIGGVETPIKNSTGSLLSKDASGAWIVPASTPSIGGTITGGTTGSILFVNPTATIAQDNANLFYDDTYNSLYLSRSNPTRPAKLLIYRKSTDVQGTVTTTASSGAVTGIGTIFQTQVFVGDKIVVNGEMRTVLTVPSDTSLTTDAWTGSNTTQAYSLLFVGTGRVTTTSGSGTVTGSATTFLSDVAVGDTIQVNGETRTVSAIASNTSLTTDNWTASNTTQTYLQTIQRVASVTNSTILGRNVTLSRDSVDAGGGGIFSASNVVAQTSTSTNTNIQSTSFAMTVSVGARNTNNWTDTPGLTVANTTMNTASGATGTITNFEGLRARFQYLSTGAVITNTKLYSTGPMTNSGTMTNTYGFYCGDITTGTQTNTPYSFYAEDANAISFYGAGKVGINQTAPTSMLDVVASSASTVGQIIKGAASQTANLTEWQNSSATVLGSVDASGNARFLNMFTDTTSFSTALGQEAGDALTSTGTYNTAIGYQALTTASTADSNTAVGAQAMAANTSGIQNVAIGHEALRFGTTGSGNVAIGMNAMGDNTNTGDNNTVVGYNSLTMNSSGSGNVAIGANLMIANTTGGSNVAIGATVLNANVGGSSNIGMGTTVLNTLTSGTGNIGIGQVTLSNNNGNFNIALGGQSMAANTSGEENIAMGYGSLNTSTTGGNNVSLGMYSGYYNKLSTSNVFVGHSAGFGVSTVTTFSQSTFVGAKSGYAITTGGTNILIGYQAADNLTSGSKNIIIGTDIDAPSATTDNQLNIGNIIFGTGVSGTGTTIAGKIGIGTTAPSTLLHLKDTAATQLTLEGASGYTGTMGLVTNSVTSANRPDILIEGGFNSGYYSNVWLGSAGRYNFTAGVDGNNVRTITAGNTSASTWTHRHYNTQSGGTVYDVMGYTSGGNVKLSGTNVGGVDIYNHTTLVATIDGATKFYPYTASSVGLTVKGAASQTANLTEWQNSSGTVLAKVSSAGFITSPGIRANAYNDESNAISILVYDGGTVNSFYDGAGVVNLKLEGSTGAIFNESGVSTMDFRMEGDTLTHLFFLDAGVDNVGINQSAPTSRLHVNGPIATAVSAVKTANYTITADDSTIRVDTSGAAGFTVTLPTAVGITGRQYTVKDVGGNASIENITIDGNGTETIDGGTTVLLDANYESITVVSDGANWMII